MIYIPFTLLLADHIHETPAQIGQGIFHPRRDLMEVVPDQEAVGLQFPELFGQGGLRDLTRRMPQNDM